MSQRNLRDVRKTGIHGRFVVSCDYELPMTDRE